jgi:hypothetical protein
MPVAITIAKQPGSITPISWPIHAKCLLARMPGRLSLPWCAGNGAMRLSSGYDAS